MDRFICLDYEEISFDDLINKELSKILVNYLGDNIFKFNLGFKQEAINDIFNFQ